MKRQRSDRRWPRVAAACGILTLSAAALACLQNDQTPPQPQRPTLDGPLTPEHAPRSFLLEPGLRIELVAAEPLIASPVALAFDERGRLYVAENRGYPTGPKEGEPPVGRIALLEDTDGDGRMDRRADFAEGLTYPNGVMPWNGGVIVTCAPDILFLKDSDGDGRADQRRVLFTGFDTSGSTQLRVSHPTLSIDNWIHVTSGLRGGTIVKPDDPDRPPVELRRADFRFRPDGSTWESADGGAQFGLTFDDFGRRFICYNRVQVQHVVIDSKTLKRNPHLAFSETVQNCPAEMVAEPLKGHGSSARLFPISRNVTTADSHAGTFTAACGVLIWRGSNLPERYRGGAFSCDPTGNLVHFDHLEPAGASFSARRVAEGLEFLASSDNWFRPVFLAPGPDGALYVCDMYRKTIEHPDYLPVEIRKRTDFESGKDMGRIWRVVRADAKPGRPTPVNLADSSTPTLCAQLGSRDGWWRDTAHRLLLERNDPDAVPALRALAGSPTTAPATVAHALRLLEALGDLPDDLLASRLKHKAAPVREHALQLVEPRLSQDPCWVERVVARADDPDPRVRFQAAIALGSAPPPADPDNEDDAVADALGRIARRDARDRWTRAAVFSAMSGRELRVLAALPPQPSGPRLLPRVLLQELGRLLGASQSESAWPEMIRWIVAGPGGYRPEEQAALLTGFAEAIRPRRGAKGSGNLLMTVIGPADEEANRDAVQALRSLFDFACRLAGEPSLPMPRDPRPENLEPRTRQMERRLSAIGLLAFADFDQAGAALLELVDPRQPDEIQAAAVRALAFQQDARVAPALLSSERFARSTPTLRDQVLSALVSQSFHVPGVLTALEDGQIPKAAIDATRRRQLSQSRETAIRQRAEALFGTVSGDRGRVYEEYKSVVDLSANPIQGQAVFRRECASCHRLDREGHAVGPDLFGIRNQPKEAILLHLLVPDHEITQGFTAYSVATTDGRVLTGLIASETPTSITLRQQLGKEDTVLRSEIEELTASTQSLMPQGLEQNIKRQEFADLLAYLKGEGGRDQENPR